MKTNYSIWMLVGPDIGSGSGYSRRVLFELELLSQRYGKIVLIYPESTTLPEEFESLCIGRKIPFKRPALRNRVVIEQHLYELMKDLGKPKIIYGQNLVSAYLLSSFSQKTNIPLFFDYHGVVPIEAREASKNIKGILKERIYKYIENVTLRRTSTLVTVSENFKETLQHKKSTIVLPMLPSNLFLKKEGSLNKITKKDLGIQDDSVVFCYLGQAQHYQMPEVTIRLYKDIEHALVKSHLIVLSKDVDTFREYAKKYKLKHWTVLRVSHNEVPDYLNVCDYGFVLRGPSQINKVASPTKVLEYVSQGVTPIFTEHVGDYSKLLLQQQLGIVVPYANLDIENSIAEEKIRELFSYRTGAIKREFEQNSLKFIQQYKERHIDDYLNSIHACLS